MTTSHEDSVRVENLPMLQRIAGGSFASIFISQGGPFVFKVLHNPSATPIFEREFFALTTIHRNCHAESFFKPPRPYAYFDPLTGVSYLYSFPNRNPYRGSQPLQPIFNVAIFRELRIREPSYAMERVFALPWIFSDPIRELFYPPTLRNQPTPSLCRLYLGKLVSPDLQSNEPSSFFDFNRFALDLNQYNTIAITFRLPTLDEVITAMGDMLARLHWDAGSDGRGVQWVMGGDGFTGVSFFVLDFHQAREWGKTMDGIPGLVNAFISNDPYYPRPRPSDDHYQIFRRAYIAACPRHRTAVDIITAFLTAIEQEQQRQDGVHEEHERQDGVHIEQEQQGRQDGVHVEQEQQRQDGLHEEHERQDGVHIEQEQQERQDGAPVEHVIVDGIH